MDYKKVYNDFWKELVENPDGSLNKDQIMKELYDFYFIINNVPVVYDTVTGGACTKAMYEAQTVVDEFEKYILELQEAWLQDLQEEYNLVKK